MTTDTIIRTQQEIPEASTAVLLATYNALTGESVARFSTRAAGERRVAMAMLAAVDRVGHAGVKPNTAPAVKTIEELTADKPDAFVPPKAPWPTVDHSASNRRISEVLAQDASSGEAFVGQKDLVCGDVNPFQVGTLAHGLWTASRNCKPIEPPPKVPRAKPGAKAAFTAVRATFAGKSKPQEGSIRNSVLHAIQAAPNRTITVAALEAQFEQPVRGFLQKLIEKEHIVTIDPDAAEPKAAE